MVGSYQVRHHSDFLYLEGGKNFYDELQRMKNVCFFVSLRRRQRGSHWLPEADGLRQRLKPTASEFQYCLVSLSRSMLRSSFSLSHMPLKSNDLSLLMSRSVIWGLTIPTCEHQRKGD
jgi:hypothetical protein